MPTPIHYRNPVRGAGHRGGRVRTPPDRPEAEYDAADLAAAEAVLCRMMEELIEDLHRGGMYERVMALCDELIAADQPRTG